MKRALPHNSKVANDAKECMQECVTEFILFITSEYANIDSTLIACCADHGLPHRASERCAMEKRKTLTGEDILWAMGALSFDCYVEPLRLYLQRWREYERLNNAKRAAAATVAVEGKEAGDGGANVALGANAGTGGGTGISTLANQPPPARGRPRGSKSKRPAAASAAGAATGAGSSSDEDEDDADADAAE